MKKLLLIIGAASMLAAPAIAGINPASPGLPTADTGNFTAANNGASSMCVDCHTFQPKAGGSHYVSVGAFAAGSGADGGSTNSGGSGIDQNGAIVERDNGAYFKLSLWSKDPANTDWPSTTDLGAATYSKYRSGNASVAFATVNGTRTASADGTASNYAGYDVICESCHNIVVNDAGGNNLLVAQVTNDFEDTDTAYICVGCHGFMYTNSLFNPVGGSGTGVQTAQGGNANYGSALNTNEVSGGSKGNNEIHWIKGTAYFQNHHVMTGDDINATTAGVGILWTDNVVVSYTDAPMSNASANGSYPQKATWAITGAANVKPSGGGLTCTNCHTPAHGMSGSPGASILRGATYTAARATAISRIGDTANSWKKIDDKTFCNQCHQ